MSSAFDRIVILVLNIFAVSMMFAKGSNAAPVYVCIAVAAICYRLQNSQNEGWVAASRSMEEKLFCVLQLFILLLPFADKRMIILIPIVAYDVARSRNYIGLVLSVIVQLLFFGRFDSLMISIYIFVLMMSSMYISVTTEKKEILETKYKKLRDDSAEKKQILERQNMELIKARDEAASSGMLEERNRIAREIHDNVGHMLSRALLQMGALLSIYKEEPVHGHLEELRSTLDLAMNNIRSSVHDLHDDAIDVKREIEKIISPLDTDGKIDVSLEYDISSTLPRDVKYAVIGITKEAVSNVIKYSKNDKLDIKFIEHPAMYQLIIRDYGESAKDIDISRVSEGKGIGLVNIKSRAESVGGNVTFDGEKGFKVFVIIPKK